jgi:hypothetical protein
MKFKYSKDGTLIISLGDGCPYVDYRDTPYYVRSGDIVYQDYLTLRNLLKLGAQYES